jgi:hypothetical protein
MRLPGEAAPPPQPQPAAAGPSGGGEAVAPQSFPGGLTSPQAKRCPHCGEEVAAGIPRCPHCDTWFDEAARREDRREGPDWERLSAQGWWPRLWGTTRGVLFDPVVTFDRMKLTGFLPVITYALSCGVIAGVFGGIYQGIMTFIQFGIMQAGGGGGGGAQVGMLLAMGLGQAVVVLILTPVGQVVGMFISAAFTQLGLLILKSANKPYEVTCRVMGYAQGAAALLNVVPLCGGLIAWVWGLVAAIIGVARVQGISYWRAAVAVLLIPVLLGVVLFVLMAALFIAFAASR